MKSQTEYKLKSPPEDAISSVKFGPHTNQFLLVSSWDTSVRLYDVQANNLRHKYTHDAPVLDCCFTVGFFLFGFICRTFKFLVRLRMPCIRTVVVWIIH